MPGRDDPVFVGIACVPLEGALPPILQLHVYGAAKVARIGMSTEGMPAGTLTLDDEGLRWEPDHLLHDWGARGFAIPWNEVASVGFGGRRILSERPGLHLALRDGSQVYLDVNRRNRLQQAIESLAAAKGVVTEDVERP
jgi:hypothetical protein